MASNFPKTDKDLSQIEQKLAERSWQVQYLRTRLKQIYVYLDIEADPISPDNLNALEDAASSMPPSDPQKLLWRNRFLEAQIRVLERKLFEGELTLK